jgi:formylmethanofuran dehydrogenase subunit A
MIVIRGGTVYDPLHGVDGEVRDIWLDGERIVDPPLNPEKHAVMDARGSIIAPAGVEIHSHVAGTALNAARLFLQGEPKALHGLLPSARRAAEDYVRLGYTTVFDAAMPVLFAKSSHADLDQMQGVDRGVYALMGDNTLLLQTLAKGNTGEIKDLLAWLLRISGAYAVKLVNPGGGIAWKAGKPAPSLDEQIGVGDLTQRRVIQRVVEMVNAMGLPHPVHLHAGRLGQPGNWKSFCETARALEGQRAHLCHIQFYAYGDDGHHGYTSAAEQVVKCLAPLKRVSMDVGEVIFGNALAVSADTSGLSMLRAALRSPWFSRQIEGEGGSSALPLEYLSRDPSSAVQWATGLELMLRFPDPMRMFLTTDHPNGGPFTAYPQVIEWLMSRPARMEGLRQIHGDAKQKTGLHEITREYSLGEIFAMTSAGPAQVLGLTDRGHLGAGALADIRCYEKNGNIKDMFANPAWVMRRGNVVLKHGKKSGDPAPGHTLAVRPAWNADRQMAFHQALGERLSIRPENYGLGADHEQQKFQEVPCASKAF